MKYDVYWTLVDGGKIIKRSPDLTRLAIYGKQATQSGIIYFREPEANHVVWVRNYSDLQEIQSR